VYAIVKSPLGAGVGLRDRIELGVRAAPFWAVAAGTLPSYPFRKWMPPVRDPFD
jgi:hypothetical protein